MNYNSPQSILEQVLRADLDPPNDEYSSAEFGANIGSHVSEDVAKDLVRKSFQLLPGTLAASFIEGLLQSVTLSELDKLLIETLLQSREVGAGGPIVEFLQEFSGLSAEETARRILSLLSVKRNGNEQDRLAFALWCLICGETYEVARGDLRPPHNIQVDEGLEQILTTVPLTDYTKTILAECLQRTWRQGDVADIDGSEPMPKKE